MIKPMKCWCGNEPSFSPWERLRHREFGCYNHPTNHKYIDHMANTIYTYYEKTDEELIELWNEKVHKHNEIERKKNQNCRNCGKHYQDRWTFCPYCGERVSE